MTGDGEPILALVTDAYGGKGGIAQYNRDLLGAWSTLRRVVVLPRNGEATVPIPDRLTQARAPGSRVRYVFDTLWKALSARPRIIFCGHLYMAPLALVAARMTRARMVVQVHGIDAWEQPSRWHRMALDRADLVLSVSRFTRSRLLSWSRISPERVVVLPNTVGGRFAPGDRAAARRRFGWTDERIVLSVGRLDPRERYKGQDRVIAALPALLPHVAGLLYCIAGEGDDRERLAALARETGVASSVRFLGAVPDADLPDLYRAADLFALPSTGEGFGIVFLEAMACGTPAIGLAVAGASDALADGRLGIACQEAGFPSALASCLDAQASVQETPGQAAAVGATLAARVKDLFGGEAFRRRACEILEGRFA